MISKFLANDWTIAVFGAIISGVILLPIAVHVTNWIDKSKKKSSASRVNREVISILRNIVSEGRVVSLKTTTILIQSISRKYGVNNKFVRTPEQMIQDLLTDVLESSYISMDSKLSITNGLEQVLNEVEGVRVNQEKTKNSRSLVKFYLFFAIYLLLVIVSFSVLVVIIFRVVQNINENPDFSTSTWGMIFIGIVAILSIIVATIGNSYKDDGIGGFFNSLGSFFGLED